MAGESDFRHSLSVVKVLPLAVDFSKLQKIAVEYEKKALEMIKAESKENK